MNLAELEAVALGPVAKCTSPPCRGRYAEVRLEGTREDFGRAEPRVQRDAKRGHGWSREQARGRDLESPPAYAIGERFARERVEHAMEMPRRKVRNRGEGVQIERFGEMRVDVIDDAIDARHI
jgi:hypothetical protein